ncbi:class A beta-lactamase-related serine hydrolase [Deinococcus psychrotolerans]|uniref:Class A beta-lactamase-related serine hydrolase n=1 Tax=Deinococcus psychrotolerans TaxID=2489213 RepID=A0A3G8YKG6_9DEIO|nr:serine hydrolase domain-containing protein [Deinococcus psychrotolerans]AZI43034.1 class A beta-lactamase-related serine hydrolase [Deinococcus psychrotolerans]
MFRPDPAAQVARQFADALPDVDSRRLGTALRRSVRPAGVVAVSQGAQRLVLGLRGAPESSFEIASVTKPFTAALAFELAQQGLLDLDAPLPRQLRAFRGYPPHVTARALLTHTAGLPTHPLRATLGMLSDFHNPYGRLSAATVLASGRRWSGLARQQAGRLSYSNFGYGLLALALAEAAGEPYPVALQRWILTPLGLAETGFAPLTPLATPHGLLGSAKVSGFGGLIGAGGLYSTAADLLSFAEAHLSGRLRGWEKLSAVRVPAPLLGVTGGWFVTKWRREAVWWHDGVARGTRAALGFSPDTGRAAAVLIGSGVPFGGNHSGPASVLSELL